MDASTVSFCDSLFHSRLLHTCSDTRDAVRELWKAVPELSRLDAERLIATFEKKLTASTSGRNAYSELCASSTSSNGVS